VEKWHKKVLRGDRGREVGGEKQFRLAQLFGKWSFIYCFTYNLIVYSDSSA